MIVGLCLQGTKALAEPIEQLNDNANMETLSIVSEDFAGPLRWMAEDLAVALTVSDTLRVLPVFGTGGGTPAPDILYLKSMDVAFVHSDLLAFAKRHGLHSDIENRLRYITQLYSKEIGVIATKSVRRIRDLAGRKVNLDATTSSSLSTSVSIFELLGIHIEAVQLSHSEAIEKIKSGEIAATVLVDDKPNTLIATLVPQDGLHLVPIEPVDQLRGPYQPTSFTSDDYPNLIAPGRSVDSVGVSVVMAMYNWPPNTTRYGRVAHFVDLFFSKLPELRGASHHPAWQKVDIGAPLAGWTRFKPAEDWLERHRAPQPEAGAMATLREVFQKFLALQSAGQEQELTEEEQVALFELFLAWKDNPDEASIKMRMTALDGDGRALGVITAKNTEVTVFGSAQVGLLFKPDLAGLAPGSHAFLIHANPACGPREEDGTLVVGLAAGGPLQLVGQNDAPGSSPPLIVAADGTARQSIVVPGLNLADLLDRSVMIYANGSAASARIACGVVD